MSFTLDVYTVPGAYFVHPYRDAKLEKFEICGGYKNSQKNYFMSVVDRSFLLEYHCLFSISNPFLHTL